MFVCCASYNTLLSSSQDEKEQLNEFKTHLEGLKRRAKTIIQLKPRNPATPIKGKLPVQAVCDFKQMEVIRRSNLFFVHEMILAWIPVFPLDYSSQNLIKEFSSFSLIFNKVKLHGQYIFLLFSDLLFCLTVGFCMYEN